jgi:hypothetical protein
MLNLNPIDHDVHVLGEGRGSEENEIHRAATHADNQEKLTIHNVSPSRYDLRDNPPMPRPQSSPRRSPFGWAARLFVTKDVAAPDGAGLSARGGGLTFDHLFCDRAPNKACTCPYLLRVRHPGGASRKTGIKINEQSPHSALLKRLEQRH